MRVLITGGLGYIGGRLVNYLGQKAADSEIFIAEHPQRKIPEWAKEYKIIPLDLLSGESIRECVKLAKPDCIIHLAAVNEIVSAKNPELADRVNRMGTEMLIESAHLNETKKFIYFSTFHVYGRAAKGVITEDIVPEPAHPYASSHLEAEKTVRAFSEKNMDILVFRLSNSYGYPMDKYVDRWSLLVNDLCRQAVVTGEMILVSSGSQKRDFLSMNNVVEAVRYFIFDIPGQWGNGLYNLGSGTTISISDMAHKVQYVYNKKYGKTAKLILGNSLNGSHENAADFTYSIDKLANTGYQMQEDSEKEIWKTMDICERI